MDPQTVAVTVLSGFAMGLVYGTYGFLTKREPGERFNARKLARTAVVWGAAGALVAVADQGVTEATVREKAASIGAVGILVDQLWIYAAKRRNQTDGDRIEVR